MNNHVHILEMMILLYKANGEAELESMGRSGKHRAEEGDALHSPSLNRAGSGLCA